MVDKSNIEKQADSNSSSVRKKIFYKVKINKDKCKGCRLCILFCKFNHLELSPDLNKRGVCYAKIKDDTECKGCGACFLICPDSCIEIYEGAE